MACKKALAVFFSSLILLPVALSAGINISGKINTIEISGGFPPEPSFPAVEGASISFLGTEIGAVTDAAGDFTLQDVPGRSVSGLKMTKTGYKDAYTQIVGLGENNISGQDFIIFTEAMYNERILGGTAPGHTPGRGEILGMALDILGSEMEGVVVQAAYLDTGLPAGTVKYFSWLLYPDNSASTNALNGFFCVYNVEPGRPVLVRGTKAGTQVASSLAVAYADALTLTILTEVPDTLDISGIVLTDGDGDDEVPLAGAAVNLPGMGISDISKADGTFTLSGIPVQSAVALKASMEGYLDTYIYGHIDGEDGGDDKSAKNKEEEEDILDVFMISEEMLEWFQDAVGEDILPGKGLVSIDPEIQGVSIKIYDDFGNPVLPLSDYYFEEDGPPNPALSATEPNGECVIMNLEPGYYYITGEKDGFEFPLLWVPVFAGGITVIDELWSTTETGELYKEEHWNGQVPAAEIFTGSQEVPMFTFNLFNRPDREDVLLESITFTAKGTGDISSALSGAKLYYDSNNDGLFDAEAGTAAVSETKVTLSGIDTPIGQGSNNSWQLVFDFNGTAAAGETFGVDLLKNRDVVSSGAVSTLDVTCRGNEITGNLMTVMFAPPEKPQNISPADGETDVLTAGYTLEASPFTQGVGQGHAGSDVHQGTHWQVRRAVDTYAEPFINEQTWATSLTDYSPPYIMEDGETYYWRVRYIDGGDIWSEWSDETWFTAETASLPPQQPVNTYPENGADEVATATQLTASAFVPAAGSEGHAASHWQVTETQGDYSLPVFDSGRDTANLAGINIPQGTLNYNTDYWWRVRYHDSNGAWSNWSVETGFTTEAVEPGDINGDGSIDISDVILCLRIAIGLPATIGGETYSADDEPDGYPDWLMQRADINGQDGVNISDVILILRLAVELPI